MKAVAVATALLAAGAVAAPNSALRRARNEARAARVGRKSNLRQPAISANGTINTEFSENWAGAVISETGFTSVTGTFVVPTPKRNGETSAASAWVGIDGDTCPNAILQTGIDFIITGSGEVSYDAWYEWFPEFSIDFVEFTVNGGDEVRLTVTATSTSSGSAVIENLSTGQTVSHSFSSEANHLCEFDAEWIVEDFESGGGLVPFANFDSVTFTDASAVQNGKTVGVSSAGILDIEQNTVLTDCSIVDDSTLTCNYV